MNKKLYVLVRKDLPKSQQAVQGGHAVAEFLLRGPSEFWSNGTLVYLGVRNENDLKVWGGTLGDHGHSVVSFREPDRNNEVTALAVFGAGEELTSLKLL